MEAIKRLANNAININADTIIFNCFELNGGVLQAYVIDLLTYGQLFEEGVNSLGERLGDYSPVTIEIKRVGLVTGEVASPQRYDHITLRHTGSFYESYIFDNRIGHFVIKADTIVEGGIDLQDRYGKLLLLTDESLNKLRKEILPYFIEETRRQLLK